MLSRPCETLHPVTLPLLLVSLLLIAAPLGAESAAGIQPEGIAVNTVQSGLSGFRLERTSYAHKGAKKRTRKAFPIKKKRGKHPASPSRANENNYGRRAEAQEFISRMVQTHKIKRPYLDFLFSKVSPDRRVIDTVRPPSEAALKNWESYLFRFMDLSRIEAGRAFRVRHSVRLGEISRSAGVPEEVILGILGVETRYGREMGNFPVLQTLATLAFDYPESPKRAERKALFLDQLEAYLLLCRETERDPLSGMGSFAGAIGIPQFLPKSIREHGADGNGDGRVDLVGNVEDAMASVARFLGNHGWEKDRPVLWRIPDTEKNRNILKPLADGDPLPKHRIGDLLALGLEMNMDPELLKREAEARVILVDLPSPGKESAYALGFKNFYAITRYNRSFFYAMSVFTLGEAVARK